MTKESDKMINPGPVRQTIAQLSQEVDQGRPVSHEVWEARDLRNLQDLINRPASSFEPKLYDLITKYQAYLEDEMWATLETPINNPEDFDAFLRLVNKAHKRGLFDSRLESAVKTLRTFLNQEKIEAHLPQVVTHDTSGAIRKLKLDWGSSLLNRRSYWKARHLVYEICDYFNLLTTQDSEQTQREGLKVYSNLRLLEADWQDLHLSDDDIKTIREMVLFSGCRANELRRNNEQTQAHSHFRWLFEFTQKYLSTPTIPCHGTLAYLLYNISVVLRDQEQLDEAEKNFSDALIKYYERAMTRKASKNIDDALFTDRRVSMCIGLGFGWINLTRGQLRRAENAITTALPLLAVSEDRLISAYLTLLLGNIKRCRAGNDHEQLFEAIEFIQKAEKSFRSLNQDRYLARAKWELSIAYTLLRKFDVATDLLADVEKVAREYGDHKWLANVAVQRSRILREEGCQFLESNREDNLKKGLDKLQNAVDTAEAAIDIAKRGGQPLPTIDALMARGQARFALADATEQPDGDYVIARQDFQKVLKMLINTTPTTKLTTSPNPKIAAVCHLYIARCFVREGNQSQAAEHYEQWRGLEAYVEHEWVRELACKTKEEIEQIYKDLIFKADDPKYLNYDEQLTKLRSWIFKQALRQTEGNMVEAAKRIGVSRATLYQWTDTGKVKRGGRT
jgi:tetratricopeptide (TPR) repeat protein